MTVLFRILLKSMSLFPLVALLLALALVVHAAPLHDACAEGDLDKVSALIKAGADVNVESTYKSKDIEAELTSIIIASL